MILGVLVMAAAVVYFIVFMERAQRRLMINYPKRQVGNRMYEGQTSFLPLKLNTSGVIPPIFASSLLLLPATAASFQTDPNGTGNHRHPGDLSRPRPAALHAALRGADDHLFAFFLHGGGVQPAGDRGQPEEAWRLHPGYPYRRALTAEFIDKVLSRITVIGAAYLTVICLIPEILVSYPRCRSTSAARRS